jgi:hypothetical protein
VEIVALMHMQGEHVLLNCWSFVATLELHRTDKQKSKLHIVTSKFTTLHEYNNFKTQGIFTFLLGSDQKEIYVYIITKSCICA